ncbi:MAG: GntR family transcriptional regulator [Chloroflexi bacterium]|nr:GntR family transcriptional regulator [Chloroflexota bacterium]
MPPAPTRLEDLSLPRIDATLIQDRVYESLRESILRGDLPADTRLSVGTLAAKLGVSRYPVATALQRLALEGYVVVLPRQGTFVTRFDTEDFLETLNLRLLVERYAAPLCVERATDGDVTALEEIETDMEAIALDTTTARTTQASYATYSTRTREFHEQLIGVARSEALSATYRFVLDRSRRVGRVMTAARIRARFAAAAHGRDRSQQTHQAMIEALRSRDADRLCRAFENEVERIRRQTSQALAGC